MNSNNLWESPAPDQPRWRWSDLLLILLGIAGIFLLGLVLILLAVQQQGVDLSQGLQEPTIFQSIAFTAVETVALVAGVYFFGMRRRDTGWEEMGFRPVSGKWYWIVAIITILAIPLTSFITYLLLRALGLPFENPQIEFLVPPDFTWIGAIGILLFGGLVVPFAEELFFRGVLYTFIRQRWGAWAAIFLSSLVFAVVHVDIAVAINALVLGLILALLFEFGKSLWLPVILHAANNSIRILLLYLFIALGIDIGV